MTETSGFLFMLLGLMVFLLFVLLRRVSVLSGMIRDLSKKLDNTVKELENSNARFLSGNLTQGAASKTVPNPVIAAISAAVNKYRMENNQ